MYYSKLCVILLTFRQHCIVSVNHAWCVMTIYNHVMFVESRRIVESLKKAHRFVVLGLVLPFNGILHYATPERYRICAKRRCGFLGKCQKKLYFLAFFILISWSQRADNYKLKYWRICPGLTKAKSENRIHSSTSHFCQDRL